MIGNGVVVDPWALVEEIAKIEKLGRRDQPRQSAHRRERPADPAAAPRARRAARGGSGRRQDRHHRARHRPGLRGQGRAGAPSGCMDLAGPADARAQDRAPARPPQRAPPRPRPAGDFAPTSSCRELGEIAPKILPYVDTVWALLDAKRRAGKRILFEGAQGALLDIDHGTYPFVTSSNTVAAQAATGSGLGPGRDRLRARHHQGLHHARRRGAVPDRAQRRDRRAARRARPRVRHRHRPQAPLRLVRRRAGAPDRAKSAASTASR